MPLYITLSAALLSVLLTQVTMIPLEDFYEFGAEHGDERVPPTDDGSSGEIQLSASFPFFDTDHNSLFVNTNGDISFVSSFSAWTPTSFPRNGVPIIAPYWADADTRTGSTTGEPGIVWYRETADPALLQRTKEIIANAFVVHANFEPTLLFIATWDHVGYSPQQNHKKNTFQCVLATNGVSSFVIFLYADDGIQWTTGSFSGGTNGLGGTPAQVGIDAGDGVRFISVPGALTDEIINIPTTSNIGIPGVWILQEIQLTITPHYGSHLGGQTVHVQVQGLTFEQDTDIECLFGDKRVKAVYVNEYVALCISPMFDLPGRVDFALQVDMEVHQAPQFTALSVVKGHCVDITPVSCGTTLIFTEHSIARLQWNPDMVFPALQANEYNVDISLYRLNIDTEQWNHVLVFATETGNDGEEEISFQGISIDGNTAPIAVFVSVTLSDDGTIQSQLKPHEQRPGVWSAEFYFATPAVLESKCSKLCLGWYRSEPNSIGNEILSSVSPCPRTEQQASQLCNSGVIEEDYVSVYGNNLYAEQRMKFFHPDATTCYKQPLANEIVTSGRGQQCCYDENGYLITGPPSGGTVDLWSAEISPSRHYQSDIEPFILCCKGQFQTCGLYYERRPSDNGSRFNPPPCGWMIGDPHFVTLDGFRYTFNGYGEFVLLHTVSPEVVVQGRMEPVTPDEDLAAPGSATVLTAIVAKQGDTDAVQFQLSMGSLDVLVNGERVMFDELHEHTFQNLILRDLGSSTLSVIFSSGMSITVQEANGILSVIQIVLPETYRGSVEGLLGNYNGDPSDDLIPRSGGGSLPTDVTSEELHNNFGITWIIDEESDSCFTYDSDNSWSDFYSPSFEPTFLEDIDSPIADEVCGNDPFCRFDIIVSGRTDIATTTLESSTNVDLVAQLSLPVTCTPPCEHGVCVAVDTCVCSTGYAGVNCNEIETRDILEDMLHLVAALSCESSDRHWKVNAIKDKLKSMQNDFVSLKQRLALLKSPSTALLSGTDTCSKHKEDTEEELAEIQSCLNEAQDTLDTVEGFLHPCGGPGWRRIVYFDMTDRNTNCPSGWEEIASTTARRSCGGSTGAAGSCYPVMYNVNVPREQYSQVCGRIRGYQLGLPSAFLPFYTNTALGLNDAFVDGIVVSRVDAVTSTRQHIWTFAAGALQQDDNPSPALSNTPYHCPCLEDEQTFVSANGALPSFLNGHYFCESGLPFLGSTYPSTMFPNLFSDIQVNDPLWDGLSCATDSQCCNCAPPYFTRVFDATDDPIEVRLCFGEDETVSNIGIELIELYVR